jgi:hypothetical protein
MLLIRNASNGSGWFAAGNLRTGGDDD